MCEGKSLILGYSNLWGGPPVQYSAAAGGCMSVMSEESDGRIAASGISLE